MNTAIVRVAKFLKSKIPSIVYAGASTLVSFLTGPVGWVLLALGAITIFGGADEAETAAAIIQIHMIKVEVLQANIERHAQIFAPQQ